MRHCEQWGLTPAQFCAINIAQNCAGCAARTGKGGCATRGSPPGRGCLRHFAPLPLPELVHGVGRAERELDDCANRTRNRCVQLECDSVTPPRPRSHSRPPRPSRPRPSRSRPRRKRLVFLNTRHEQDFSAREVASLSGNRFERRLVVLGERVDRRSGTGAPPSRPVEGRAPARACRSSPPRSSLSFVSTLTVTFALVAAPCHRHAGALAPQFQNQVGYQPVAAGRPPARVAHARARPTDRPTDRPPARPRHGAWPYCTRWRIPAPPFVANDPFHVPFR